MKNRKEEDLIKKIKKETILARILWSFGVVEMAGIIVAIFSAPVGAFIVGLGCMGMFACAGVAMSNNEKTSNNDIIYITNYEDITNKEETKTTQSELKNLTVKNFEKNKQDDGKTL